MTQPGRGAPLRVAMVIHGYFPCIGGAERQLAAVAPVLQRLGVDVHVITRRFAGLEPRETVDGVDVHRLTASGSKATSAAAFVLGAVSQLLRLRPDVIHAHDVYSPTTAALLVKHLVGTPVVVKIPRGGDLGSLRRVRSRNFGRQRMKWLLRAVDAYVVINREIDEELAAIGVPSERRASIPNGVDTGRFAPVSVEERNRLRTTLDAGEGPIVTYTGRLAPEKRLGDLLAIWPQIRRRHPTASLVIVGSGPECEKLASRAGEGIRFTGAVLDVAAYLQASDLFVLPSAAEGLSNSLLEAMATGLPCVATAVAGTRGLIDHAQNGWLVPPGDPDSLLQAILTLLGDARLRASLGRRALRRVEAHYSLARTAGELHGLYRRLAGAGG